MLMFLPYDLPLLQVVTALLHHISSGALSGNCTRYASPPGKEQPLHLTAILTSKALQYVVCFSITHNYQPAKTKVEYEGCVQFIEHAQYYVF